jgi:hydroxymethylbilane synthase
MRILKIGSRPSRLAIKQVEEIKLLLPGIEVKAVPIETKGDRDKTTPLSGVEGTDFFTREIEEALIEGRIDAAVHSAKDLEETQPEGLTIVAMTGSLSPHDCLVSQSGKSLKKLPPGSRVGTSSQKRKESVIKYRPDLVVQDIRGNVEERLAQLDAGSFDAVIVAHAALIRLGLEYRIAEIIPRNIIEPHPLQGALAVQVRKDREDLIEIFRSIDGA